MASLKLPKYLTLPDGKQPITGCTKGDVAEYVILTNYREQVEAAAKMLRPVNVQVRGDEAAMTVTGKYGGFEVTIANGGVGVGQNSNIIEELINIGGRVFIQLGATGALQEDVRLGDVIIPVASVRDEGLSDYYAPKQYPAVSDYRIVLALRRAAEELGYRVHTGIIRTTEGFYPSQRIAEYVELYSRLGVLGVEQETSGIFTLCSTRGCYAGASLMVIGNLVTGLHYWQGDSQDFLRERWFSQIKVILMAISILRAEGFPGQTR